MDPPMVTVATAELEQPPVVPVTVYDVFTVGETISGLAVDPVFHTYVVPPVAVNVSSCPGQAVREFTVITGGGFTVIV